MASNSPLSFTDASRRAASEHLDALIKALRDDVAALERLQANPGDDEHFYLEGLRLIRHVVEDATMRRDYLSVTAHGSRTTRVSIPALARAAGVSVNTLRDRIARATGMSTRAPQPFNVF